VTQVADALAAVERGDAIVIPTDTVYGLATTPFHEDAVLALARFKHRDARQPIALLAPSAEALVELLPELDDRARTLAHALLPGPYTLVFPNPARRFPWLGGDTLGVRVPALAGDAAAVLAGARALAATSANLHGGADPATLADVPPELREAAAVVVDGGTLPGTASTVLDCTGAEPRILREGAGLDRVREVLAGK